LSCRLLPRPSGVPLSCYTGHQQMRPKDLHPDGRLSLQIEGTNENLAERLQEALRREFAWALSHVTLHPESLRHLLASLPAQQGASLPLWWRGVPVHTSSEVPVGGFRLERRSP
jgi:hypothetical protein